MSAPATTAENKPAEAQAPAKPKRKNLNLSRLGLSATSENGKNVSLTWGVMDENPRLIVKTDEEPTPENSFGRITAALDTIQAGVVFATIRDALGWEPGKKVKIPCRSTYVDRQRFDKPTEVNNVAIGKDNESRIWITVLQEGRPQHRFYFEPSNWWDYVLADGTKPDRGMLSAIVVRGYLEIAPGIVAAAIAEVAAMRMGEQAEGGGSSGGYQKPAYQGNGGGYNKGGYQGGGGYNKGGYQGGGNRGGYQGGGGGGGYRGNGGGGGYNKGGYNGGGGGYQNRGGNNGGYQKPAYQGGGSPAPAAASLNDDDITF